MLRVYKRKPADDDDFLHINRRNGNRHRTIDPEITADMLSMYHGAPIFKLARQHTSSTTLSEPFTWSVKQLNIGSTPDMERIFEDRWLPWGVTCQDWIHLFGVCPFRLEKQGEHQWPVSPDMRMGSIHVVSKSGSQQTEYYWNEKNSMDIEVRKTNAAAAANNQYIYWIVTEDSPLESGELRSNMFSILPNWRTLCKLKNALDIVSTQRARPMHVIEQRSQLRTATNDNLMTFEADFSKAAGVAQARQDYAAEQQQQLKQHLLSRDLRKQQQQYYSNNTMRSTLYTDTHSMLREEEDTGFGSRVVVLRPDTLYREAAKPELVGDYAKMEMQFNVMAAALMGFSLETITATGSARSQSIQGVERFENQRMRKQTRFFEHVFRDLIALVYRDMINENIGDVADVHPELDVIVELPSYIFTQPDELRAMRSDGIITQETMGKRLLRNSHIPEDNLVTLMHPDNVPVVDATVAAPAVQKKKKRKKSDNDDMTTK